MICGARDDRSNNRNTRQKHFNAELELVTTRLDWTGCEQGQKHRIVLVDI